MGHSGARLPAFWSKTPIWDAYRRFYPKRLYENANKFGALFPPFFPRFHIGVLGITNTGMAFKFKKEGLTVFFLFFYLENHI